MAARHAIAMSFQTEFRPPAKSRQAGTTTHEIRTAGYVGGGFHLGHEECWIATIMSYYCGRNTAPLIGKMKKLLRHPGGHNRLGSSDNMTARAGRPGLGWAPKSRRPSDIPPLWRNVRGSPPFAGYARSDAWAGKSPVVPAVREPRLTSPALRHLVSGAECARE